MRKRIALVALGLLMATATTAQAADWTTAEGGGSTVTSVSGLGIVYIQTNSENATPINVRDCLPFTVMVFGTGVSVMPQACSSKSCTNAKDLRTTALTGSSTNVSQSYVAPTTDWFRLTTTDDTLVTLKCGK